MSLFPRLIIASNDTHGVTKIETVIVPLAGGGVGMIIECIFLCILTGLWTALRLWCRRLKGVPIALEDFLHLAALFFFYGMAAACIISVAIGGAGHHVNELQTWHVVRFSKTIFAIEWLYSLSVGFVKISITVMLMRIFVTRRFQIAGKCILAISVVWMIHPLLTGLLVCRPIEMNWNPDVPGGSCGNQYVGFGVVAAVDIINELCLMILPIPSLYKLHMSRRYKIALGCVFCTGIITLVVAIARVPVLIATDFTDLTYDTRSQMIALAEPAVAIVVSCSPLLRPLFDKALSFITTTYGGDNSGRRSDLGSQPLGNRSHVHAKPRQYSQLGDSAERVELGNIGLRLGSHDTAIFASKRLSNENLGMEQPVDNDTLGILVMREAIVTRGHQQT